MSTDAIKELEALKEQVYYVDGVPNLAPYADKINAVVEKTIEIFNRYCAPMRESIADSKPVEIDAFGKWRPMSTAPIDGRGIMVFVEQYADNGEDNSFVTGGYCEDDGRFIPSDGEGDYNPTHWMPLPKPPTTSIEGGQ